MDNRQDFVSRRTQTCLSPMARVAKKLTKGEIYLEYSIMIVVIGCYMVLAIFKHMFISMMPEDGYDITDRYI
jgi:hypothetical protein